MAKSREIHLGVVPKKSEKSTFVPGPQREPHKEQGEKRGEPLS